MLGTWYSSAAQCWTAEKVTNTIDRCSSASTSVVHPCLFDELRKDKVQAAEDTDEAGAVPRPDVVYLEDSLENLGFIV